MMIYLKFAKKSSFKAFFINRKNINNENKYIRVRKKINMKKIIIRNFDKSQDLNSIHSFLISRKESHNLSYKDSEKWFKWKFLNSPNGSAIMPTVFNNK